MKRFSSVAMYLFYSLSRYLVDRDDGQQVLSTLHKTSTQISCCNVTGRMRAKLLSRIPRRECPISTPKTYTPMLGIIGQSFLTNLAKLCLDLVMSLYVGTLVPSLCSFVPNLLSNISGQTCTKSDEALTEDTFLGLDLLRDVIEKEGRVLSPSLWSSVRLVMSKDKCSSLRRLCVFIFLIHQSSQVYYCVFHHTQTSSIFIHHSRLEDFMRRVTLLLLD